MNENIREALETLGDIQADAHEALELGDIDAPNRDTLYRVWRLAWEAIRLLEKEAGE